MFTVSLMARVVCGVACNLQEQPRTAAVSGEAGVQEAAAAPAGEQLVTESMLWSFFRGVA